MTWVLIIIKLIREIDKKKKHIKVLNVSESFNCLTSKEKIILSGIFSGENMNIIVRYITKKHINNNIGDIQMVLSKAEMEEIDKFLKYTKDTGNYEQYVTEKNTTTIFSTEDMMNSKKYVKDMFSVMSYDDDTKKENVNKKTISYKNFKNFVKDYINSDNENFIAVTYCGNYPANVIFVGNDNGRYTQELIKTKTDFNFEIVEKHAVEKCNKRIKRLSENQLISNKLKLNTNEEYEEVERSY